MFILIFPHPIIILREPYYGNQFVLGKYSYSRVAWENSMENLGKIINIGWMSVLKIVHLSVSS